jgi:hypothetical protein
VWLVLAGLLALELDRDAGASASAPRPAAEALPPRPPTGGIPSTPVSLPSPEPEAIALGETRTPDRALALDQALASTPDEEERPPLSPSLRSALDEPILLELTALLETVHADQDGPEALLDPTLTAYVGALTRRMNTHGETFVASVSARDPQAARRRAAHLHGLLVEAGLRPWLLEVFGERGADGVSVERG